MFFDRQNSIKSIDWVNNSLKIIDQTELPGKSIYITLESIEDVYIAIRELKVRGAPAIGVAAAFGLYLGVRDRVFPDKVILIKELNLYLT